MNKAANSVARLFARMAEDLEAIKAELEGMRVERHNAVRQYERLLAMARSYADDSHVCPFCEIGGDHAHHPSCIVAQGEKALQEMRK